METIVLSFIVISCVFSHCLGDCYFNGQTYPGGTSWNSSCSLCKCHSDKVSCSKTECPFLLCKLNEVPFLGIGDCCPKCSIFKKTCDDDSTYHVHGTVWSSDSNCILYECQDGFSISFAMQCPSLVCSKNEVIHHPANECCPRCISLSCFNESTAELTLCATIGSISSSINSSRDCSLNYHTERSNLFWKDPCTLCATDYSNNMNCYKPKCPACGSHNVNYPYKMCCPCPKESCEKGCIDCLTNRSDYCTLCESREQVIYNGKCIDKCPAGYFKNERNHCKSCSSSCKTCFGNMTTQCFSCKKGFYLQKGRCVKKCDLNYYISADNCTECHTSCESCIGPSENDCISCALQGQLLQDGHCADTCSGHFYVTDNYCLPCNESCARCLKDGTCQFCEKNFYLEEGVCLLDCSVGYFKYLDAYCLPCHDECQQCFGPLSFQCTSCPFGLFLLHNSCVWDCGQGYYGDLGAGVCRTCHPDCRSCLGASNDNCLSCSNGYLLPYIGTHFGKCVQKCPVQYFLSDFGICEACYEACQTCYGGNDTECMSCRSSFYFKNGRCVLHCGQGFFHDNGVCYACHPSCATCHGFRDDECYTCPPGRSFKYGRCNSLCEDGKYMEGSGACADCDISCSDCISNDTETGALPCLNCKNQQLFVLYDSCVKECPSNFYLNSYHICEECHPSCATCERNGAIACVTCWDGYFLTHLGTCEAQCRQGYFPFNGVCQACNSNCHHCVSASKCLRCKGDLVLQFGECIDQCSEQHYVDAVSRECKECSWECNTCHGPLPNDCTSCMLEKLFEVGSCVKHCSDGFYKNDSICEACDLKCLTCSSLNKCTSCDHPLLLLNDECVDDCGAGFYADLETLTCKTCSYGCIYCVSGDQCGLCASGFFSHAANCVKVCPAGHFPDLTWRTCIKNTENPILTPKNVLRLPVGGTIFISTSFLNASDADSDSLYILATEIPKNGFLLKMTSQGEEKILNPGNNFTSLELSDGQIFFKHISGVPVKGPLKLKVTDGFLMGNEINFDVQVTSDFPPQITQLRNIIVSENSHMVINSSVIQIEDKDNIHDITLHVIQKPCYGSLILLPTNKEVELVNHEEFLQNKFAFKSSKNVPDYEDNFIVQAFDGFNSKIIEVKLFILPQDSTTLFVVKNKHFFAVSNEMSKLTSNHLLVLGENILPEDIIFKTSDIPSAVQVLRSNGDQNGDPFVVLNSNVVSFTQDDIDSRRISIKYLENVASSMDIPFKVSNRNSSDEIDLLFKMHFLEPQLPVSNSFHRKEYGIMVLQNHPALITQDHLVTESSGISPNDTVYIIIRKLLKDEGILENLDKPGQQLQSFTQQDINKMKIVYHPPPYLDSIETQFIFQFIVLDAKRDTRLSPLQNFTITVRPPSTDLTSPASFIDHEITILLSQGETVELGANWLSTAGHEIPEDQLEVVLSNAPQHGMLIQKQNEVEIEIFEDDGFSFTSIINDAYYKHDGSDQLKDSAVFKVMGGPYSSLNKVNFIISRYDKESPVILDSTALMGSVAEGDFLDIHRHHLAYTDLISGDAEIVFTLLNEPKYGKLEKNDSGFYRILNTKDTFSQQDINDLLIRYNADSEIGDETVRDFLYFDVADGSGNVQANQVLTMKVKPKIKEPPIVKVTADIQVDEGGGAVIEPHIITVFDPDSPLSDLVVVIERQPEYGYLENSKPIPGLELSLSGIPISVFPYIDLVEGYIKYIQLSHLGVEPEKDTMLIHITDGHLLSETHLVNIIIKLVNDESPHLFAETLIVHQGGYTKVLNSTIFVLDADTNPNNLLITFNNLTQRGTLRKLQENSYNFLHSRIFTEEDSFTFQDILDGLVMYVHESTSASNDSFTITVSDGYHTDTSTVEITVVVKDREVPFLLHNLGLEILPGNSSTITKANLQASDVDSPEDSLIYTITAGPTSGLLMLLRNDVLETLSSIEMDGKKHSQFTQIDINEENLIFHHSVSDPIGIHHFKFNIHDQANNTLMDQMFFITISEDIFPPMITKNTGLIVLEKKSACITSEMLAAVDEHVKSSNIIFSITSAPNLGFLQKETSKNLHNFTMSDISSGNVCYNHTAETNEAFDSFTFTVSDGKNHALQTFYINITTGTSIPFVKIKPLLVKEGQEKVISEFEIDILDRDSSSTELFIQAVELPYHGVLKYWNGSTVQNFTFDDIKRGNIVYFHDDSDVLQDNFKFIVFDGVNSKFILEEGDKNVTSKEPIAFPIKIIPMDDAVPMLVNNKGLQIINKNQEKNVAAINKNVLWVQDTDTENEKIAYIITVQPQHGFLELSTKPGVKVSNFTQSDIEENLVQYIFVDDNVIVTEDKFIFSFEDSKPTRITNNIFSITWTRVKFISSNINCSESDKLLEIPVRRYGNLHLDFTVQCQLVMNSSKNKYAVIPVNNEIHFDNRVEEKKCIFELLDNSEFEGKKQYSITLISTMAFFSHPSVAVIDVYDNEDEPALCFRESVFHVNETNSYYDFVVIRKGDTSKELSVMCSTSDISAHGSGHLGLTSGTDYISRAISYESLITFHPGETEASCKVKIVDDSIYEGDEDFQLSLSNPHPVGRLQNPTKATVIIQGFNDASFVNIKMQEYNLSREMKNLSISLIREGVDLSQQSSVRCGIKSSANKEEEIILYHEIKFEPFQTSAECPVALLNHLNNSEKSENITVFLEAPVGCMLGPKNNLSIHINEGKHTPVIEFGVDRIVVKETDGFVQIPILKTGDLDQNSTIICISEDGTAKAREDYEERYQNRKVSVIHLNPKDSETFCDLHIYDDKIYEGPETLKLKLMPSLKSKRQVYILGTQKSVTVEIIDAEDATIIELEKNEYEISENIFPNASVSAVILIIRNGDVSTTSKVRISTIDGSASSGLDYYAKSKLIHFAAGEKQKKFEIEILYNRRRNWASFFTVILGPDEILNAELGNISKAIVVIPCVPSSKSLILPAVPVVVSLLDLENISQGLTLDAKSGYPLICITPCDANHPDYSVTNSLCIESGIKNTSLDYQWEVSMPTDNENNMSHFERITDATLFTSVNDKVLDSIYFRPYEKVRCTVSPRDAKGHLGIPLKSAAIKISPIAGFCLTSRRKQNFQRFFPSQSFIANLEYINSSNSQHPNKLHIHVEIPHEDGLLPLISTYPLHNIEFLLTQSVYQQQHVCSNLLQSSPRNAQTNSFSKDLNPTLNDMKHAFPWHTEHIKNETRLLYQHLDLRKCKWSFDSWYSISELRELCGGTVTSDFKTRDTDQTYVTVVLPLYVTYLFAAAPTGWISIEYHTQLEFSFFYKMFLSKSGSHFDNSFDANLNIVRIGTNSAGQLYFEFKTEAKFYGLFVLEHYTVPGLKSHISVPHNIDVQFDLQLLWTEQTFEGPSQLWKATSYYNLKDYSGNYTIHLIPCKVTSIPQLSLHKGHNFLPCITQPFQKFVVPLVFQQTNRPVPVSYELSTFFQIFNDENLFLQNPFKNSASYQYIEYKGAYSKGDTVYGRVFWSPEQELAPSYQLRINEVILCAAANAFSSVEETFEDMLKYGCIMSNQHSRYKFILLDRKNPDAMNLDFQGIAFEAKFIDDSPEFSPLATVSGVDGFTFKIDPLYEINANQQWFLQIMYSIKPTFKFRARRAVDMDTVSDTKEKNGTNIKKIVLKSMESSKYEKFSSNRKENEAGVKFEVHHFMYLLSLMLIIIMIFIMTLNKSKFQKIFSFPAFLYKQYILNKELNVKDDNHCNMERHRKSEKCRVIVYKPIKATHCESSETEV